MFLGGALTLTWSMVSYDIKALYWQGMVDVGISNVPGGRLHFNMGQRIQRVWQAMVSYEMCFSLLYMVNFGIRYQMFLGKGTALRCGKGL